METGLSMSAVLMQFPKPTIAAEIPDTVPLNVGDARFALSASAAVSAVESGLLASDVLSTFERPTMAFVIPETVPEKVGDANVAYDDKLDKRAYDDNDAAVAYDDKFDKRAYDDNAELSKEPTGPCNPVGPCIP